jgi:hypothetical protein
MHLSVPMKALVGAIGRLLLLWTWISLPMAAAQEVQPSPLAVEAKSMATPSPTPTVQPSLEQPNTTPRALAITLREMQRVKVDDMDVDVPTQVIPLMTQAKHQLRDLFGMILSENPDANPVLARKKLIALLAQARIALQQPRDGNYPGYGVIEHLRIVQPTGHPDLLIFVPALNIVCGEDSAIYLFQKQDNRWRLAIAVEVDGYRDIREAAGNMQYTVQPSDAQGNWFLAYSYEAPMCYGMWVSVGYGALRPSEDPYKPRVLVQDTATGDGWPGCRPKTCGHGEHLPSGFWWPTVHYPKSRILWSSLAQFELQDQWRPSRADTAHGPFSRRFL